MTPDEERAFNEYMDKADGLDGWWWTVLMAPERISEEDCVTPYTKRPPLDAYKEGE